MKILYLTSLDITEMSGGGMATNRNFTCLCYIFGRKNIVYNKIELYPKKHFIDKIYRNIMKLFRYSEYLNEDLILSNVDNYDIVFIEGSKLGHLAKLIKEKGFEGKIFSYFHNCEYMLDKGIMNNKWNIANRISLNSVWHNESYSLLYSDCCIFINQRDKLELQKIYKITPIYSAIVPVTLEDKYKSCANIDDNRSKPIYTFLGSYFAPNISGIKWFIDNVFPFVEIKLRIVGKGMDKLKLEIEDKNIEIYSDVLDLSSLIKDSDYMLYPIFKGSGMKVKTCEALMYGKNIIATSEAFSGYEVDYSKVGACCNTAEEFINSIMTLRMPRYNEYSRKVYLEKYSLEASLELYKAIFMNNEK